MGFDAMPLDEIFARSFDSPLHLEMRLNSLDAACWKRLGVVLHPHREHLRTVLLYCVQDLTQDVFAPALSSNLATYCCITKLILHKCPGSVLAQLVRFPLGRTKPVGHNGQRDPFLDEVLRTASLLKVLSLSKIDLRGTFPQPGKQVSGNFDATSSLDELRIARCTCNKRRVKMEVLGLISVYFPSTMNEARYIRTKVATARSDAVYSVPQLCPGSSA